MKVKVVNSSSRKTRENIKKAFANLLKEKHELSKITVIDIVKKADITRSAFYTHYDNIYDVAREIQEENIDMVIKNINSVHSKEELYATFDNIFKCIKDQEEIYSAIFSSNEPLLFTRKIKKIATDNIKLLFKNHNDKELELKIAFYTEGCANLLIKYFRNEIDSSFEDIKAYTKKAFRDIFS